MIRRPPRSTRTDTPFPTRRSSDLLFGAAGSGGGHIGIHLGDVPLLRGLVEEGGAEGVAGDHRQLVIAQAQGLAHGIVVVIHVAAEEIGRASCRERVWQYG